MCELPVWASESLDFVLVHVCVFSVHVQQRDLGWEGVRARARSNQV